MKQIKCYVLLLSLTLAIGFDIRAQFSFGEIKEIRSSELVNIDRNTPIWLEDFSNGIPEDWLNSELGGLAQWEYRGPNSNPSNETGPTGSCANLSNPESEVIMSPSAINGFVLFDSNKWDSPSGLCSIENFGTGSAPGPHLAQLTTASINLMNHPHVALRFNQFFKKPDTSLRVEISTDAVNWTEVYNNDILLFTVDQNNFVQVPISNVAGGESNVQIRFVFEGLNFFWQLDDICIVEILPNNLSLNSAAFSQYDFFNSNNVTGYEFMRYTKYPNEMAPLLKLSGICENVGSNTLTNCKLQLDVVRLEDNTTINTLDSGSGVVIESGANDTLMIDDWQMVSDLGNYDLLFSTSQTEVDNDPENNTVKHGFQITDVTYARDYGFLNQVYTPEPQFGFVPYEIGNVFQITSPNQYCYSVSVALAAGSSTPSSFYGKIYEFDFMNGILAIPLGSTEPTNLTAAMLNNYGETDYIHLVFDEPILLEQGKAYLVMAASSDGPENVLVGFSGSSEEYSSWLRFPNTSDWFYLTSIPMVRMNFGTNVDIEEIESLQDQLSIYPNPVLNTLHIDMSFYEKSTTELSVINQLGNEVFRMHYSNLLSKMVDMDTSQLSRGIYLLRINNGHMRSTTKFIKE